MKPSATKARPRQQTATPLAGRTILQVIPELDTGGAEQTVLDVARAIVAAGGRALVACRGGGMLPALKEAGGHWHPLPLHTKNPLKILLNARALARLIRAERVDLVHARSRAPAWSALMAAGEAGIPFVTTAHGAHSYTGPLKTWYNSVMARGDVTIANSAYTAARLRTHHPLMADRIVVVHRGVDLARFTPEAVTAERRAALRQSWGVAADRRIVLLPARLSPRKGHETTIEAIARLPERERAKLAVVFAGADQGRAAYVARLEQLIARHGLSDIVRLTGHCADMPAAYALAELALVPSGEPEAFGRTAAEAQAMGVPVIATDIGATSETVLAPPETEESKRTGWRIPPSDPAALAAAIAAALALNPQARSAMAGRGRAHVAAHFSLDGMISATLAIYRGLLEEA